MPPVHSDVTLRRLGPRHLRLGTPALWADVLEHPAGNIRIGAFPDIVKALGRFAIDAPFVVMPPRRATVDGDNWTGEEFVGWTSIFRDRQARTYLGTAPVLAACRAWLDCTIPWYFDDRNLNVVRKRWMDDHFRWQAVSDSAVLPNGITLVLTRDGIQLRESGAVLLELSNDPIADDGDPAPPPHGVSAGDSETSARDRSASSVEQGIDGLRVTCLGSGNGMGGRSASFVIAWGDRVLLLDPTARPHAAMHGAGIPWRRLTDLLVTHNHEDHILGVTAALETLRREGRRLTLLTSRSILDTLGRQLESLWPDVTALVEWVPLEPETRIAHSGATIEARQNHHILPWDTLGLTIEHDGRRFGFSGDTKYDLALNAVLGRRELDADWFADCDAVVHEAYFGPPGGIHTHVRDVETLAARVPGALSVYHCSPRGESSVGVVEDGMTYEIGHRTMRPISGTVPDGRR